MIHPDNRWVINQSSYAILEDQEAPCGLERPHGLLKFDVEHHRLSVIPTAPVTATAWGHAS